MSSTIPRPRFGRSIRDAADGAGFSFHEAASLDRRQQSHKGYKGRSGSEDVAHFDVVFNLQKPKISARMRPQRNNKTDITMLVRSVAKDGAIASQGVQAVHAEVMRRLASIGSVEFADYAEVRAIYEGLTDRSSPTSKRDMTGPHSKPSAVNRRAKARLRMACSVDRQRHVICRYRFARRMWSSAGHCLRSGGKKILPSGD